ncbi:HEAT repeat domain-containing protein [Breznakiellaceae bacterium SP9]
MKKILLSTLLFVWLIPMGFSTEATDEAPAAPEKSLQEERMDIINYGTETEITALIKSLRDDKVYYLDDELVQLIQKTRNQNIVGGVFSFFGERSKGGLEERAIRALEERDEENVQTVLAAVNYLGAIKEESAIELLQSLIDDEEERFMNVSIRALGKVAAGKEAAAKVVEYLIDVYSNKDPGNEAQYEIVAAIGESGAQEGVSFLAGLLDNTGERPVLRAAAVQALSKIGHTDGLDAIIAAVNSNDPNLRAAALEALGPFSGDEVDAAILDGFRDSFFRTRISAAKAARVRELAAAIPYLRFRVENDEVPSVREESIRALGAIGGPAIEVLKGFFLDRKKSDLIRIRCAQVLMEKEADEYAASLIAELTEAKQKKHTNLYNNFLRILGTAKSSRLEGLAAGFLASGDLNEKSLAMDIVVNNEFHALIPELQKLGEGKNASLARKAKVSLDKLGRAD